MILNTRVVVRLVPGVHPVVVLLRDPPLGVGDDTSRGGDTKASDNAVFGHLLLDPPSGVVVVLVLAEPGRVGQPEVPEPGLEVSSQTSVPDDL